MATFIPVPQTAQFQLIFSQQGQSVENVFHVLHADTSWTATQMQEMCAVFKTWWATDIKSATPSGVKLMKILAQDMGGPLGAGIEYVTGLPLAGDTAAVEMPMNVTVAVKWLTALRGRSYRGRTYHVGLSRDHVTGSTVEPTSLANFTGDYAALITAVEAISGCHLVVVSKRQHKAWLAEGIPTRIIGVQINNVTDSQRRRLPERGQ